MIKTKFTEIGSCVAEYIKNTNSTNLDINVCGNVLDILFSVDLDKNTVYCYLDVDEVDYLYDAIKTEMKDHPLYDSYVARCSFIKNEIEYLEFEKRHYTASGFPWWHMDLQYDDKTREVVVSLGYNDVFIESLRKQGYYGNDPDDIVDQYIASWHRQALRDMGQLDE